MYIFHFFTCIEGGRRYEKVFIQHDQTSEQRFLTGNFRAVISTLNDGGSNVSLRGMRVVRNTEQSEENDRSRNAERKSRENTNDTSRLRPSQGQSGDSRDVRDGDNRMSGQVGYNIVRRDRGRSRGGFRGSNRR